MGIHVLGDERVDINEFLSQVMELYKSNPLPPHFYLVYDMLYELRNTDIVVKLNGEGVETYVIAWRYRNGGSIHVLDYEGLELLRHVHIDTSKPHVVELYSSDGELIERTSHYLLSLGFKETEVKWFHDMITTGESFRPSPNEFLATRLTPEHVEVFADYAKSGGEELSVEEAREKLTKRTYFGVFVNGKLVSAGAVCAKLPEACLVCDIYTRSEYRRRGYATAVTSAITRRIVSSGAVAFLCVEKDNVEAIRVYEKLGYRVVNTRPWIIAKPSK
jgi:ribosomal protein S18 acetylase RimI-like enzyme